MLTSLRGKIEEGSFLVEMRHSLTHKVKINTCLIETIRAIIVREIRSKYWDCLREAYIARSSIDVEEVMRQYRRIVAGN